MIYIILLAPLAFCYSKGLECCGVEWLCLGLYLEYAFSV